MHTRAIGRLVDGKWVTQAAFPTKAGRWVRAGSTFRDLVTADGSSGYVPEAGRYHLYVSYACPWAHRALMARALLGLEEAISISVTHPFMGDEGWSLRAGEADIPDPIHRVDYLWQLYVEAQRDFSGRVTVPVLWDRERDALVNNESRDILRMFATVFRPLWRHQVELSPPELRDRIDEVIDAIYAPINDGVYRSGFARTQEAYEEAVTTLFAALDHWNEVLGEQRFTCGNELTEADLCLFATLLRFDVVYHGHFKCNIRRIVDYPNLWGFVRDVYQLPRIAPTCNLRHIKEHYYRSHETVNPTRIVPLGPAIDFDAPHDRARFGGGMRAR